MVEYSSSWPQGIPDSMEEVTSLAKSLSEDGGNDHWVFQYLRAYREKLINGVILRRSNDRDALESKHQSKSKQSQI